MDAFITQLEQTSPLQWTFIVIAMLAVWFLPAALALMFNRKHFKLILLACIPAGFSLIAWSGLMVWATTGKVMDKYLNKEKVNAEG